MKHLTIPTFFLTFILTACGGGGGGGGSSSTASTPTTPSAPQQLAPSTTPQVIEYYGDSTIWGYQSGTGERVAVTAPQAFARALSSPPPREVINEGRNSTTSCQLLEGTDGDGSENPPHRPWAEQMRQSRATHVIINHGINDALRSNDRYRSCMEQLARIAQQNGKRVIFETPNPISAADVEPYVVIMRNVANQVGNVRVIDQYQFLINELNGRPINTITPDGLHPTDEVYIRKGQFAAREYTRFFP